MARSVPWEVNDTLITPEVLDAVKHVESRGNPNAVSPAGAVGPYQFMPATAARFGLSDPRHEPSARDAAARYLTQLAERYGGDVDKALLAYNWGEGNVDSYLKSGRGMKGQQIPVEAQQYVGKVRSAQGQVGGKQSQGVPWEIDDTAPGYKPPEQPKVLRKSAARQAAEMTLADMNPLERGLAGAGKAVSQLGQTLGFLKKEDNAEADAALLDDTAGMVGNIGGEVAMTAVPGTAAYKAATMLPKIASMGGKVGQILRMATGGAAAGATGEGMMGRDPLTGAAYGAVLGPAVEKGVQAAGQAIRGGRNLLGGAQGAANRKVQEAFTDPAQAAAQLRALRAEVPGEQLTVGMAATPQTAGLKAFEHFARRSPGAERLLKIDAENEAARLAVLEPMAARARPGTAVTGGRVPDSPAEAARRASSSPAYKAAEPDMVTLPASLEAQLLGPEAAQFTRAGQSKFAQEGLNNPSKPAQGGWSDPENGMPAVFSVAELQQVKNELLTAIKDLRISDPVRARQLADVRRNLNAELESQSANFAEANRRHRILSAPQNRGQVAQAFQDALRSPAGAERTSSFLAARRNAPQTIKGAGIDPRFTQVEQVFTPGQMKRLGGLERSVQRQADYDNLKVPESILAKTKTFFDFAEDVTPPMFSQMVTTIRRGFRVLGRRSDAEVDRIINEAVADPAKFATMLETLPPGERMKVMNLISTVGKNNPELAGGAVAATSGQIEE